MRTILAMLGLLVVILLLPVHAGLPGQNLPTTGSTLFFDDFTGSQFPSRWITQSLFEEANVTQIGGYLVTVIQSGSFGSSSINAVHLLGNSTNPLFGSLNSSSTSTQFISIAFKMQPFNITSPLVTKSGSSNYRITADLQFGMASAAGGGGLATLTNGVYFDVMQSNGALSLNNANYPSTKSAVMLNINRPMSSATNSYVTANAMGTFPAIAYNGVSSPIDLASQHTFVIQMEMDKANATNTWVRWQVDNFGWVQLAQTACSCLTGATGDVAKLFPFITTSYYANVSGFTVSQSLGSAVDWVYVTDFAPASFPSGQLFIPSSVTPPSALPQPGVTGSLTAFIQFEANGVAPGNLYAGGMLLTMIVSGTIFAVLFGVSRRFNIPIKHYGLFFTMFVLVLSFFFFWASVLPIWVPAMMVLITVGIAFGVIRTGSASGGLVPD